MLANIVVAFLISALTIQSITAQYCGCNDFGNSGLLGNYGSNGIGNYGSNYGIGNYGSNLASGGRFPVASSSPISSSGISIYSENVIEGPLCISGNLPLLATVVLEGQVPSSGQVAVEYGCGNGNVGITSDNSGGSGYGAGLSGIANGGCGCGY